MKAINYLTQFFPRAFRVWKGKVCTLPSTSFEDNHEPMVAKTHSVFSPLTATMQIFADLIHLGNSDPVGMDCFHVSLTLSIQTTFIRHPASGSFSPECDSLAGVNTWLSTVKKAFLVANRFAILPRFPDRAIEEVFTPLFDTVSELHQRLDASRREREQLLENHFTIYRPPTVG